MILFWEGYNGDRLRQTVNSVTTGDTLDLNAGLVQVLSDGSITYLYGNARILQDCGTCKETFLTDALGSVRQLVDASGTVILGRSTSRTARCWTAPAADRPATASPANGPTRPA